MFNTLTTGDQMSFQIGCSVEENVVIRASKRLEQCIDIAHVAYMIIVPQKSDDKPVFLHTPPSEFTYNFFIHNVYFIKESSSAEGPRQLKDRTDGLLETKEG